MPLTKSLQASEGEPTTRLSSMDRRTWGTRGAQHSIRSLVAVATILAAAIAQGAPKEEFGLWRSVSRIHGVATIEYAEWIHEPTERSDLREAVQVEFTLERDRTPNLPANIADWDAVAGRIAGERARQGSITAPDPSASMMQATFRGAIGDMSSLNLTLDVPSGTWQFVTPGHVRPKYEQVTQYFSNDPDITRVMKDEIESVIFNGTVAKTPTLTQATYHDTRKINQRSTRGLRKHATVVWWPEYSDVEVEVTIEGYDTWRPLGSIAKPGAPGNSLVARATLKSKDGKTKDLPQVNLFRFELIDTSREPGICLNWPLGATDSDYDLAFADPSGATQRSDAAQKFFLKWGLLSGGEYDAASMPTGALPTGVFGAIADDRQRLDLTDPATDAEGRPFADAMIESFDFGAKSELRVTCVLADGREIIGLMKSDAGHQDIVRLPRREGPDWIATAWREQKDVAGLGPSDDSESIAGQPMNGDGFTLYEEYRGWVVDGKHRDGDPKRKDFFVLNQRGADFRGGIALFGRLSQLRVHSTLRDGKEMSEELRCMNRNRRDAPHRVDQHGVVLMKESAGRGANTIGVEGVDPRLAFRPRTVARIYLEWSEQGRGLSTFSQAQGAKFNLSPRDADLAWDRAVAHELLHAVGVDHHGERLRMYRWCYFQGTEGPLNPTGRPRYVSTTSYDPVYYTKRGALLPGEPWSDDRGPEITLLWEDTGKNVFEDGLAAYQAQSTRYRMATGDESYYAGQAAYLPQLGRSVAWWKRYVDELTASYPLHRLITIGAQHGTDSGNDLCVMKYYFADAYEIHGKPDAYYLIRPGAVVAGRQLCLSRSGTGGNAINHQPQSRFGDAGSGRGNCFGQICPNDAIPPRQLTFD